MTGIHRRWRKSKWPGIAVVARVRAVARQRRAKAMPIDRSRIASLVRDDAIHASIYTDPDIFALEMERLFGRSWIFVGHESQVPRGGYFSSRIGTVPVLLLRDAAGTVRVVHNRCPHRGAQICTLQQGQATSLTCPYHGWTFSLSGQLVAVPLPDEYPDSFKLADHGLAPVPRVEVYRGFVFANLDPAAGDLASFLGAAKTTIDNIVDRAPEDAVEAAPTLVRHRYKGNWKLGFENLNDTIHAAVAHAASVKAARKISAGLESPEQHPQLQIMIANGKPQSFFQSLDLVTEEYGHSFMGGHMGMPYRGAAGEAYYKALVAARGKEAANRILAVDRHLTLVYPSSTWHARFQTVRFVRPLAPNLTEFVGIAFRLKGAPDEIYEEAVEYCTAATSAHSTIITDDLEIYETIQRTSESAPAWLPISRGLGPRGGNRGANIAPGTNEVYIRNQYRRWSAALAA